MQNQIKLQPLGPFILQKMHESHTINTSRHQQWSQHQKIRYLEFLINNQQELSSPHFKQIKKYFPLMAKHIQSRNWNQCRIYHEKMLKKYHSLTAIIEMLSVKEQPNIRYSLFSNRWPHSFQKQINFNTNKYQNQELYQNLSKQQVQDSAFILPLNKHFEIIDSPQLDEKDEKIIPTDVTYRQQTNPNLAKQTQIFGQPRQASKPFNTSLPYPPLESRYIPPQMPFFHPFLPPFPHHHSFNFPPLPVSSKYESEWQQCHHLFLLWSSKLSRLLQQQSK